MSFYTDASLIMFPSGYKEDKIYSLKPTDGSGDLTFTRASTATRVNAEGLIETSPVNLLQQSEDFTTTWNQVDLTIGTNATTAPNGTSTADSFTSAISTANHLVYQLLSGVSGAYTFSVYVKKANSRYVYIKLVGNASQWVAAAFDLNDGTLTKSEATGWTGLSASSQSVGNGWYKLIVSGSGATSVNFNVGIQYTNTGTPTFAAYADASFTGTGTIDYYIWGAQVNIGATVKPYFPTTDRLNVPRIDYTGGNCGSLLLEKQSTNLVTYSEQFDNAAWSKYLTTISPNNATSPDGTQNADMATSDTGGDLKNILNVATSTTYTFSFYVKRGTVADAKYRVYNFDTGTNIVAPTSYISQTNTSTWVRISVSFTSSATGTSYGFYLLDGASAGTIYLWGAQVEASSYPTSYIPTLASSVTRLADAAYKTGISSLIGQTEGTLFCDVNLNSRVSFTYLALSTDLATTSNYLGIGFLANSINFESVVGAALQANIVHSNSSTGRFKIAAAYKANDFVLYINGVQIGTDTSGTVPACSQLGLNAFTTAQALNYNSVQVYKTRLTNAELATLTTL